VPNTLDIALKVVFHHFRSVRFFLTLDITPGFILLEMAETVHARAAQYWDRKRALSHLLGEHNRSTVVWDYIAVYAPGAEWQDALPKPVYSDDPVRDVIGGAKESVQRVLATGTASAGGEK